MDFWNRKPFQNCLWLCHEIESRFKIEIESRFKIEIESRFKIEIESRFKIEIESRFKIVYGYGYVVKLKSVIHKSSFTKHYAIHKFCFFIK